MDDEPSDHEIYLADISEKDKPWDIHRAASDQVRNLYHLSKHSNYASRINDCSRLLGFSLSAVDETELKLKLKTAFFCRVRHCPTCQWRRSMKWRGRFFRALPLICQDHPTVRWIFLTLTVRNCPLEDLRATLKDMSTAWNRFSRLKAFPGLGWIRAVEVTRSESGETHPHYHCLIAVPSSYFGKKYLKQTEWTQLWKDSLRVDYTPVVDVRPVRYKSKDTRENAQLQIFEAVCETFKYSVKESDLTADASWLAELTEQLHKTRAIATGGILKQYLIDKDEESAEDLIHLDEGSEETGNINDPVLLFGWREKVNKYSKEHA